MTSKLSFDNNGEPLGSFEDGMEWAVEAIGEMLGVSANDYSWDAATEEWEGDVKDVMCSMLSAALGETWADVGLARCAEEALAEFYAKGGKSLADVGKEIHSGEPE